MPFIAHRLVAAEQFHRQADQIVEIDRLIGRQRCHIAAVNPRCLRFVFGNGLLDGLFGIDQAVLPERHGSLDAADQLLIGGNRQVLHNREAVIAIHDGKTIFQAQFARFLAQDLDAQRVKGADGDVLGLLRVFQELGDTLLHFGRRLVGKGERRDVPGVVAAIFDQMLDFLRNHACLARAGTGQHQTGAVQILDGFPLGSIETEIGSRRHKLQRSD